MAFHAWICTLCICRPYSVCVLIATTSGNYSSLKERCRVNAELSWSFLVGGGCAGVRDWRLLFPW